MQSLGTIKPVSIAAALFSASSWYDFAVTKRAKFVTFEGLDGCGKSTQLEKLAEVLRRSGIDAVTTREPGGTKTGEKVRQILLDSATSGLAPSAEMALMFASRAQHLDQVILPALEAGRWVLCDRFTDSTEAYQGGGRKLGTAPVLELHRLLCDNIQPDLTVLMDGDLASSVARARRRNHQRTSHNLNELDENRFEQESRAFFTRVRNAYLAIAERETHRVVLVDSRGTPEQTHAKIVEIVRSRFKLAAKSA